MWCCNVVNLFHWKFRMLWGFIGDSFNEGVGACHAGLG